MGKCVFMHRADSIYADEPATQYQFPRQYLGRAQQAVGDWVLYLEPTKVRATKGYFAIARVSQIIPDPRQDGMYRALIAAGSYLEFARPVPFRGATGPHESGLLNHEGGISGRAQAAIRPVSQADFDRIVAIGLDLDEPLLPRVEVAQEEPGLAEAQEPFVYETDRQRVDVMTSRLVRDRVFRKLVLNAYDRRCAITGLRLINGGGRAEVDAAHIRPVEQNGPDCLSNGLALSGTAHWMFDRGLIGLGDDFEILVSRHVNDVESVRTLINGTGRALVPPRPSDRPHPAFLSWHRTHCFKT